MAEPPDSVANALRERYTLQRELGRGGMAVVYLAHDVRHARAVALKILHPNVAAPLGPDRFLREIQLTASLQHPHILPLHDSGEASGRLWYTMHYFAGESLRERRGGPRRLRHRAGDRRRRGGAADPDRHGGRHAGLHEPGAGHGSRELDPRSDLYAVGCVLYEMLAAIRRSWARRRRRFCDATSWTPCRRCGGIRGSSGWWRGSRGTTTSENP